METAYQKNQKNVKLHSPKCHKRLKFMFWWADLDDRKDGGE